MVHTGDVHADGRVVLVDRARGDGGPSAHARRAFEETLADAGAVAETVDYWTETDREVVVVSGTTDDRVVSRLLSGVDAEFSAPEGVIVRWCEIGSGGDPTGTGPESDSVTTTTALVVAGTDERGLTYALSELTDRVRADGLGALESVEDRVEFPENRVRGVDRFVEGPIEDEWLTDEAFWHYYLERLVRCRFNRFVLVTGYDTAFMSPPYPFVVEVPGFPDVHLTENFGIGREEYRQQLRRIGELCHEYGLEFVFGIWQQQPWQDFQGTLVEGLPEGEAYADYCAAGLRELLVACPEIDGVQLRVNYESGVTAEEGRENETAEAFWNRVVDAVAEASEARGEDLILDLRAKGCTDGMIDHGLETGLDVTVPTKFWCESTGLPYHNSQMRRGELENLDDPNRSRRYSYADLLEKPRSYDILYRLWVIGTNRIFLWGDPEYARRFSRAATFGGSVGFEITAPLSLKGGHAGLQEAHWPLFEDPTLRDYEYEDERYWAWYLLFGRMGYSSETDSSVWERELRTRFGEAADAIRDGYRAASKVLPLLTAAHLASHPALLNWAELDTGGALFEEHNYNHYLDTYGETEPSDPGLFYGIDEFVRDDLAGERQGKYTPLQVAEWYAFLAHETRSAVSRVETNTDHESGELESTLLDFRMLTDLAEYHAHKTHAAIGLCTYRETDDVAALTAAHESMTGALEAWTSLAERGQGTYHDDLVFGSGPQVGDEGQWIDRLEELEADLDELERLLEEEGDDEANLDHETEIKIDELVPERDGVETFPQPTFHLEVPETHSAGEDLTVSLETGELRSAETVRLHYRHTNQLEGAFETLEMTHVGGGFRATIPGEYVTLEWDLLVYASVVDADGSVVITPGIYHAKEPMPYRVVEVRRDRDGV